MIHSCARIIITLKNRDLIKCISIQNSLQVTLEFNVRIINCEKNFTDEIFFSIFCKKHILSWAWVSFWTFLFTVFWRLLNIVMGYLGGFSQMALILFCTFNFIKCTLIFEILGNSNSKYPTKFSEEKGKV
jgi:hypothetical protein